MDQRIKWLKQPESHNYPAALSYLSLIFPLEMAVRLVEALKTAETIETKAKDIFRASGLSLFGISNSHVKKDLRKIKKGKKLSPLLLVSDRSNGRVIIGDGYHRLCAVYAKHEDIWIHHRIVDVDSMMWLTRKR